MVWRETWKLDGSTWARVLRMHIWRRYGWLPQTLLFTTMDCWPGKLSATGTSSRMKCLPVGGNFSTGWTWIGKLSTRSILSSSRMRSEIYTSLGGLATWNEYVLNCATIKEYKRDDYCSSHMFPTWTLLKMMFGNVQCTSSGTDVWYYTPFPPPLSPHPPPLLLTEKFRPFASLEII